VTHLGEQINRRKSQIRGFRSQALSDESARSQERSVDADPEFKNWRFKRWGPRDIPPFNGVPDNQGIWRNWASHQSQDCGPGHEHAKQADGRQLPGFWKVFSNGKDGKESRGYYRWQEPDGSFRDKYMVCAPVQGTPYYVAATTYLDEFTQPVKQMEAKAVQISTDTRNIVLGILFGTLLLIGVIVAPIRNTADQQDQETDPRWQKKISVGEMDAEIPVTSRDEIGDLRKP